MSQDSRTECVIVDPDVELVRELEARLRSKQNALAIALYQRDQAIRELTAVRAELPARTHFPKLLGGWF